MALVCASNIEQDKGGLLAVIHLHSGQRATDCRQQSVITDNRLQATYKLGLHTLLSSVQEVQPIHYPCLLPGEPSLYLQNPNTC